MVEWEDGQLIQEGYVEIRGVRYPIVMPQYSGNTPVSAENLLKMQNDLQLEINNIVESGNNSNGDYIKYSDGTMICYGRKTITVSLDISYGAAYRGDIQTINLPEAFINTNYRITLQALAPIHVCYAVDNDKSVNSFKFYPVAFVSQTQGSRSIEFMAIGRWK